MWVLIYDISVNIITIVIIIFVNVITVIIAGVRSLLRANIITSLITVWSEGGFGFPEGSMDGWMDGMGCVESDCHRPTKQ